MNVNARIRLAYDMPPSLKAYTYVDPQDNYYIYVNENLCPSARGEALQHEFRHIANDDFQSKDKAADIERRGKDHA